MTRSFRATIAAIGLLCTSTLLTGAQERPPATAPEVTPGVLFSVSGSYGGGSSVSVSLGTSDWYETVLFAGDIKDPQICMGGTTGSRVGPPVMPQGIQPVLTWRVGIRLQSFDGATAVIDVRWRRDVDIENLQPSTHFEGEFTWRASEGETRVLDFVRQTPPAHPGCDTLGVEMRYMAYGPTELREAAIGYDIWVLQRLPNGERRAQYFRTTAMQGAKASFGFPAIDLDMPDPKTPSGRSTVELRVTGSVTGRIRRDGRIDVAVGAGRFAGLKNSGLSQGNAGRTRLTVAQSETVEFTPPPLFGDNDGPYAEVFKDAQTAIRVRAKRLW